MNSKSILPLKEYNLVLKNKTIIMGILNVSPESPVDLSIVKPEKVLERAQQMKFDGADIIDVGGNSTSSKAPEISTDIELKRVIPVVKTLVEHGWCPYS